VSVMCVSPSPALDRVAFAPGASAGGTVRAAKYHDTPGGKAIHAALVALALGAPVAVVAALGGRRGELVADLAARAGLALVPVGIAAETRGAYILVDEYGDVVEVLEPPPVVTGEEVAALIGAVQAAIAGVDVVVTSGSLPAGAPVDLHARIVAAAHAAGAFVIVDAHGEALAAALAAAPDLVKANRAEAVALVGEAEPVVLADRLRGAGAIAALVTLGSDGALLATDGGTWHVRAPAPERVVSAVGCGDAVAGGIAAGIVGGRNLPDAVALGVAAATARLAHLDPGHVDAAAVTALTPRVAITPVEAWRQDVRR
jgi:1-phosphofructokinase family hexose kinase